jgi:hypothetical protein
MTRIELSRLTSQEKDALIMALLERVAALEAQLNQPPRRRTIPACRPRAGRRRTGRHGRRNHGASARAWE